MLSEPVKDTVLVDKAAKKKLALATAAPRLAGERSLAGWVRDWFKAGFAPAAMPGVEAYAAGTAPAEVQTGPGVAKLVKSWDALKLVPTTIDARVYGRGSFGFVRAEVQMPLKKGGGAAPLVLGAIVVSTGRGWKWTALQFATPLGVTRHFPPFD